MEEAPGLRSPGLACLDTSRLPRFEAPLTLHTQRHMWFPKLENALSQPPTLPITTQTQCPHSFSTAQTLPPPQPTTPNTRGIFYDSAHKYSL